jgi:hypothetical protein
MPQKTQIRRTLGDLSNTSINVSDPCIFPVNHLSCGRNQNGTSHGHDLVRFLNVVVKAHTRNTRGEGARHDDNHNDSAQSARDGSARAEKVQVPARRGAKPHCSSGSRSGEKARVSAGVTVLPMAQRVMILPRHAHHFDPYQILREPTPSVTWWAGFRSGVGGSGPAR